MKNNYEKISALIIENKTIEKKIYDLQEEKFGFIQKIRTEIMDPVTSRIKNGYNQFDTEKLKSENRFIQISIAEDNLEIEDIEINDLHMFSPFGPGRYILPIEGNAVDNHPAMKQLAKLASDIIDGSGNHIEPFHRLVEINHMIADNRAEYTGQRTKAEEQYDRTNAAEIAKQHPELASDIETMDWTYDYADRPSKNYSEQEIRIRNGLKTLDLDDATDLFISLNKHYWTLLPYYLQKHPELTDSAVKHA